jgi:alpha-beta hydrolase superfamily lysophospholipase
MTRSTFTLPVLIGGLSLGGLVLALAGEGMSDLIAAAALATPVLATGIAVRGRQR